MKKYTVDQIKKMDLFLIEVKVLATTMTALNCDDDSDLHKHQKQLENLLRAYKYPCLLRMDNNIGESDVMIVDSVHDAMNYFGEYLDCKNGVDAYWDENDELIFEVTGQLFKREGEDKYYFLTQDVKLFDIENIEGIDISGITKPTVTNILNKIISDIQKEEK